MKNEVQIAKLTLEDVCGDMKDPDAKNIVSLGTPLLAPHMSLSNSEEAKWENEEKAIMLRNAFIMGYICGQNDVY